MRARSIPYLVMATFLLSGCTTTLVTAPAEPELPPLGLVGMWRVDAPTENAETWLRVEDGFVLHRDDCIIDGGWLATETAFAASYSSYRGPCVDEQFDDVPWLTGAVGYEAAASGWSLVDADGEITATLTNDGWPEGISDASAEELSPPRVSDALRERYGAAPPLPEGLDPVTADYLLGRWIPTTSTTAAPFLRFSEGAIVTTSDGCNETESRWMLSDAGRLVTTSFMTTLVGCDGVAVAELLSNTVVVGLADDGSLRLVDAEGTELLALKRER
jgi:hypothetical protein